MALREAVFGLAGNVSVFPVKSEQGDSASVLNAVLLSFRIYLDYPTDAQVLDDLNALGEAQQSITSWTNGDETNEKVISYAAIPLPTTSSPYDEDYEVYYAVLSFRFAVAADIQRNILPFVVRRASIQQTGFNVVASDLYAIESKLQVVFATKIAAKISLAEELIRAWLVGVKKLDLRRVDLDSVKQHVAFQAVVLCCIDLASRGDDEWLAKQRAHEKTLAFIKENFPVRLDSDNDGVIEPEEKVSAGFGLFIR